MFNRSQLTRAVSILCFGNLINTAPLSVCDGSSRASLYTATELVSQVGTAAAASAIVQAVRNVHNMEDGYATFIGNQPWKTLAVQDGTMVGTNILVSAVLSCAFQSSSKWHFIVERSVMAVVFNPFMIPLKVMGLTQFNVDFVDLKDIENAKRWALVVFITNCVAYTFILSYMNRNLARGIILEDIRSAKMKQKARERRMAKDKADKTIETTDSAALTVKDTESSETSNSLREAANPSQEAKSKWSQCCTMFTLCRKRNSSAAAISVVDPGLIGSPLNTQIPSLSTVSSKSS